LTARNESNTMIKSAVAENNALPFHSFGKAS
jgi:hypothetical protein